MKIRISPLLCDMRIFVKMFGAVFLLCACFLCLINHKFDEYAVSARGVIYKHMRHRADNFAVLKYGAAAHSLDYAARFSEQSFVGNAYNHALCVTAVCHNLFDFDIIFGRTLRIHGGNYFCTARFYLKARGYFYGGGTGK